MAAVPSMSRLVLTSLRRARPSSRRASGTMPSLRAEGLLQALHTQCLRTAPSGSCTNEERCELWHRPGQFTQKRYKKKNRKGGGADGGRDSSDGRGHGAASLEHESADDAEERDGVDLDSYEQSMRGAIQAMERSFGALRTGGASTSLLDGVQVVHDGARTPLKQVVQLSVRDGRTLEVRCLDEGMTKSVKKAVEDAQMNLNPVLSGPGKLSIVVPKATRDVRERMKKVAALRAEDARIVLRMLRKKAMDDVKKLQQSVGKSDAQRLQSSIQPLVDKHIKLVDQALAAKTKSIDEV